MKYIKVRNVKSLARGTTRSAGIDFYIPEWSKQLQQDIKEKNHEHSIWLHTDFFVIRAHCHILIPSGIKINMQSSIYGTLSENLGLAFIAFNKSSIGVKQLDVAATVIDEDYQGEIHLSITNTSKNDIRLDYGQKLVQFIVVPVLLEDMEETSENNLYTSVSERGTNGFGSTIK